MEISSVITNMDEHFRHQHGVEALVPRTRIPWVNQPFIASLITGANIGIHAQDLVGKMEVFDDIHEMAYFKKSLTINRLSGLMSMSIFVMR